MQELLLCKFKCIPILNLTPVKNCKCETRYKCKNNRNQISEIQPKWKMEIQAFPGAAHSEMLILFKLIQRKCLHFSVCAENYKLCVGQRTTTTFLETIHQQTFETFCAG